LTRPRQFIPFHVPSIDGAEIAAVADTLRSGWLTTGPKTAAFEAAFREYAGAPHALAVNSCTAALHLALEAMRIGPGDEVITTPMTFCATVNCILHTGATPVLADIGPDGNISPQAIRDRITPRTRAIIPVHYAGLPCDMHAIWSIARSHGLRVIEDAAHATGARYAGNPIGAGDPARGMHSDAVAFSFYATKNMTTGEGGMVTCHDPELMDRMRILALHGISKDAWNRYAEHGKWHYDVVECGFKYNLTDIQSAIGLEQLRKQDQFLEARKAIASYYTSRFRDLDELETPPESPGATHAWHLYVLRLRTDRLRINRAEFIDELHNRGIGASVHFIPIFDHSYYRSRLSHERDRCPETVALYPRVVSLPLYPGLTEQQIEYIADSVRGIVQAASGRTVIATTI
jgi:dTDP-4-amino-4,6-dideoxygalactose transaminase